MKKLNEISWNVTEAEYRADSALSYSTIARFAREGFSKLESLFDSVSTPSLTFGSMVDTLLTGTQDEFDQRFAVADIPTLSDSLLKVAKSLHALYNEMYDDLTQVSDIEIAQVAADCDYYADPKYVKTRVKNVRTSCTQWYNVMCQLKGRELVSQESYNKAVQCMTALQTDPMTMGYFSADNGGSVQRFYQLKFKGVYEAIPLRAMLDLVVVDHANKKIYPCDLKTSSNMEYEFPLSFMHWRYDIQAQLYAYILKQNLQKDEYFKDFKVMDFRFITINKDNLLPLVWIFPETFSEIPYTTKAGTLPNWRTHLKELNGYLTHPEVRYPDYVKKLNSITDYLNR